MTCIAFLNILPTLILPLLAVAQPGGGGGGGGSSCSTNYQHFSTGRRSGCKNDDKCTNFILDFSDVRKSIRDFSGKDVEDYSSYWSSEVGANQLVSDNYCTQNTPTSQTITSSGVAFTPDASCNTFTLDSNSIPNHDVENYCSAEGSRLPPYIGSAEIFEAYVYPKRPSNKYIMDTTNVVGLAVNGVHIFSPFTGIDSVATTDETVDTCNGHPANGIYHYHGFSSCIHNETVPAASGTTIPHSKIYGWAFDGFPIYGPYGYTDPEDDTSEVVRIVTGYEITSGDGTCPGDWQYTPATGHLDECNGRWTKTPEFPNGMYVYYLNVDENGSPEFPAVPYCFQSSDFTEYTSGNTPCAT
uniref:YHYH domain-containing protein n=1 Tax=Pseudictyota dubia TaxID=2749911 RepID=A0A7R9Z199_9STRA|mmetsp:Transcript_17537/g.32622  ORF Transcript_17537/g.32622 Transcript_17537/m.32622 type:complete len:356 (+) Transcript_17537:106-1173(+)|eukprot:CAMPEP_0197451808 /NCGR_PEP_ID=MMETSP1175-20131217/30180_1 /TAXON_ID=1003142 /ORGANISM="Triceratium dubium, Strain CCMP147" /LENGTH=355 /DNA_ID=CAMNT_0042984643 /DNA_START=87 /DNA_END=1154 /DNA_ORIENTATION=-